MLLWSFYLSKRYMNTWLVYLFLRSDARTLDGRGAAQLEQLAPPCDGL